MKSRGKGIIFLIEGVILNFPLKLKLLTKVTKGGLCRRRDSEKTMRKSSIRDESGSGTML